MSNVVHLLDYGAGNVRSIRNAITACGFRIEDVTEPGQIDSASVLVFPGVGAFGSAMEFLESKGFKEPLLRHIRAGKPYMGICLGMQTLFEASEETEGGLAGLGIIPGDVARFARSSDYSVPHIGWNGLTMHKSCQALAMVAPTDRVYFVHSFRARPTVANADFVAATCDYGDGPFIAAVVRDNVFATQFHPEKSGALGLAIFRAFLDAALAASSAASPPAPSVEAAFAAGSMASPCWPAAAEADAASSAASGRPRTCLAKRIIACLDVRTNDEGDLVVTKGDKYDVREKDETPGAAADGPVTEDLAGASAGAGASAAPAPSRAVRNLGKPVDLCARYYAEGADEVVLLNITAFRSEPLDDAPLLGVLEAASERVFVPLTIGGGIRAYTDSTGRSYSALDVAARYFRAGADKVSIGSDAVLMAEAYWAAGGACAGDSAIEAIARQYGRQAVVVSIDPRRVYVESPTSDPAAVGAGHVVIRTAKPGPRGEAFCWYQCTIKGGREGRPLCAHRLAQAVEALGAGELLVNCVDNDGQKAGYDEELLASLRERVSIPVIASSGAGAPGHFVSVFRNARVEAALAAGIFHRREVGIEDVKEALAAAGLPVRQSHAPAAAL